MTALAPPGLDLADPAAAAAEWSIEFDRRLDASTRTSAGDLAALALGWAASALTVAAALSIAGLI